MRVELGESNVDELGDLFGLDAAIFGHHPDELSEGIVEGAPEVVELHEGLDLFFFSVSAFGDLLEP